MLFLGGCVIPLLAAPPLAIPLSSVVWIWGIVDAYRIAKRTRIAPGVVEGEVVEAGKGVPSALLTAKHALPSVALVFGVVLILVLTGFFFLAGKGFHLGARTDSIAVLKEKLERYRRNAGVYPESIMAVIPPHDPVEKKLTLDKWGRPLVYVPSRDGYELFSAGPDGRPRTSDDIRYR